MVGNSFTNAHHLQEMVKAMLEQDAAYGGDIYALRFRKPSSRWTEDVQDPNLHSTIAERTWTWVILQEQSQVPGFAGTQYQRDFDLSFNATIKLNDWIDKEAHSETILLMTWG